MSFSNQEVAQSDEAAKTRRLIFIVAGAIAVLVIAGLIVFLKTRPEPQPVVVLDEKLSDGLRAGAPDFERYRDLIKIDEPEGEYASSVAGGIEMRLASTVRNFTGRTISGLEIKGSVVGLEDEPLKERTLVVIPSKALTELENNQTARVPMSIPGFQGEAGQKIESGLAKLKMEVTAIRFR